MPFFLEREMIYKILQRESPEGVYTEGAPNASYSNTEYDATAAGIDALYRNLERIYDNYFPQYADEKLTDWEQLLFGKELDSTLTLQQRRDRIIAKIRSQRRCTPDDIRATVYSVIDSSIPIEIVEWGCEDGGWILDESQLDISTILLGQNNLAVTGDDIPCPPLPADFGLTAEELADMQEDAYTYEVRIYGYTLTAQESIDLERALLEAEPARSRHVISDGLDPDDMVDGDT